MTCKDCFHYERCKKLGIFNLETLSVCEDFTDSSEWVHLPCKLGDILYFVKNNTDACCPICGQYDGYDNYCRLKNKSFPEIAESPVCNKQFMEIVEYTADLGMIVENIDKFGKTVFLIREEAEKALAERQVKNSGL